MIIIFDQIRNESCQEAPSKVKVAAGIFRQVLALYTCNNNLFYASFVWAVG